MVILMATFVATVLFMMLVFWIIQPHVETLLADAVLVDAFLAEVDPAEVSHP